LRARTLIAAIAAGLLVPLAAAATTRIAMLPIVVHTADTQPGYLSSGLIEMLSSRLERSGEIRVIRIETQHAITLAEPALKAAADSGAQYVLFGSFTQFGSGASLDVQCVPLPGNGSEEGKSRRVFIQSGSVAEIIPQLNELAEKLRRYVLDGTLDDGSPLQVAHDGSSPVTAEAYEDLLYRVDALEQTVYNAESVSEPEPVPAEGEVEPDPAEGEAEAPEELDGPQAASAEDGGEDSLPGDPSDGGQSVR
jgi:TolB-like protein